MESGGKEETRLFTAGTGNMNAARALAYWEAHQEMTIFAHRSGTYGPYGGYAVVIEAQTGCFGPAQWRQTSPEELVHLLGEKKA